MKTLDSENAIGVAMIFMNFPKIPQWELFDFFRCLKTFDTSMGEVFMLLRLVKTELFMGKIGTGSSLPETVALPTKM